MNQIILLTHSTNDDPDYTYTLLELDSALVDQILEWHKLFCEIQSKCHQIEEIRYWDDSIKLFGYYDGLEDGSITDAEGHAITDIEDALADTGMLALGSHISLDRPIKLLDGYSQMVITHNGVFWAAYAPKNDYVSTANIPVKYFETIKQQMLANNKGTPGQHGSSKQAE